MDGDDQRARRDGEPEGEKDGSFSPGRQFSSFEELEKAIKAYEEENYTTLYRRSSRTINAARKRAPHRHFVDKLVYYEMDLACVHGGRKYISKSQKEEAEVCT